MNVKPVAVVTGGAGFIGSHMVDLLLTKGFVVRIIDNLVGGREANVAQHRANPDFHFEHSDIRDLEPRAAVFAGARYVFHFAGIGDIVPSIEKPIDYMSANVQGTVRVLEAARAAGVEKLVYAASSSCYGLAAVPTREDHPIRPQYPYALSKYQGEQAALHMARARGRAAPMARFSVSFCGRNWRNSPSPWSATGPRRAIFSMSAMWRRRSSPRQQRSTPAKYGTSAPVSRNR